MKLLLSSLPVSQGVGNTQVMAEDSFRSDSSTSKIKQTTSWRGAQPWGLERVLKNDIGLIKKELLCLKKDI